jgi:hypothetical protein
VEALVWHSYEADVHQLVTELSKLSVVEMRLNRQCDNAYSELLDLQENRRNEERILAARLAQAREEAEAAQPIQKVDRRSAQSVGNGIRPQTPLAATTQNSTPAAPSQSPAKAPSYRNYNPMLHSQMGSLRETPSTPSAEDQASA